MSAVASDSDVYTWGTATLDGSGSTPSGASFSWSLVSAPAGSAITGSSIQNASTSKATFVADAVGEFDFTLKVTSGGTSATKNVKVHAYPGKVLYMLSQYQDGGDPLTDVHFNTTDKAAPSAISCAMKDQIAGAAGDYALFFASSIDWREGAPADDPQIVFGFRDDVIDGGTQTYIGAAKTKVSACGQSTLAKLDLQINPQATYGGIPRLPRLSPSGARIAYVRDTTNGPTVATIGFDGSSPRTFGTEFPALDASAGGTVTFAIRWLSDTAITWMTDNGDGTWSIVHANDAAAATPTVDMTCASATPNEFDVLADGSYVASLGTFGDGGLSANGGPDDEIDLVNLKPDGSKNCMIVRNITKGLVDTSAGDFALSPDKTKIAFVGGAPVSDGGPIADAVYLVPADGSSPPAIVPGAPSMGATNGNGPRWVAGGAMLAWGQTGASLDAAVSDNVVAAPVAGGAGLTTINASSDTDYTAHASGNVQLFSCDIVRAGFDESSPFVAFGAGGAFIAFAARRRKKKKTSDS